MTSLAKKSVHSALSLVLVIGAFAAYPARASTSVPGQQSSLTPLQLEIEKQARRLESAETEERRDAVTRLGSMRHPAASRAALPALHDPSAIVRATSAAAVLSLPASESVGYLVPLLADKDEFVRREVAFALGKTHNQMAAQPLIERLTSDKQNSVRGAAAVALGELKEAAATVSLAEILSPGVASATARSGKKSKKEKDLFLLRAAARSLGQIGNRVGVPALVAALQDEQTSDDVRRESAIALGLIGDATAIPALLTVVSARDPYLAEAAREAIRKIESQPKPLIGG